jgi:hypothetical protein
MSDWIIEGRYDFSIPEAQWLSDLAGIDSDLEAVVRLCASYQRHAKRLESFSLPQLDLLETIEIAKDKQDKDKLEWWDDFQMLGDVIFAAVVRYGRTHASGVRAKIKDIWIDSLPDELKEAHEYFKVLRNKFVAHSVNRLEDNQVFVMLVPQFSENQTPGRITVDRGRLLSLGTKEVLLLSDLASKLRGNVELEMAAESELLLELAKEFTIDEIKSRETESIPIPGKVATYKKRSKFT